MTTMPTNNISVHLTNSRLGSGALDYILDPRAAMSTVGGAISSGEPIMDAGSFDQSAAALRSDVLVFATPSLDLNSKSPGRSRCGCGSLPRLRLDISSSNFPHFDVHSDS